jgi:alpha-tubulin suppressor-like RCC1 family protein
MVKKKSLVASLALVLGAGLSCDRNPLEPATTGSISIMLLAPSGASFASVVNGMTSDLRPVEDAVASIALTSARVTVTGTTGAGAAFSKTATSSTPTGSNFNLTVDQVPPGSYTVRVEGLANGAVAHFGETTGVSVTAGNNTPASVSFPVFQPQLPAAAAEDTSDVLRFTVAWTPVSNATGYIVEWSQSSNMSGASSKNVTGATTTDVAVTAEGKYFFTVKAVNAAVTSGGLASAPASVFVFQGVATVTVTPATPSITAGATQQMAAEGRDADNGVVSGVTWFWASSNHTVATVSQTGLVTAVAAGSATITAVGKGMPGSATLTVTPAPLGPATKLAFVTQPTGAIANATMSSVQVAVQTASGQTLTADNATQVVLAIGTNAGGGILGGTLTATVANGIATFANLSIDKAGNGYTLTAASNALTGATSASFNIAAAAAAKLAFSIQPTNSVAGDPLSPAVQVEIRDANDNLVTSARDEITIAFGNNAGAGTLTGTKKVNAINGIASFSGLWINKMGPGYTLAATAAGLTAATSGAFTISPAAPAKLAFGVQPSNVQGNAAINPAVTVTIADQFDNQTTATSSVTLSLFDNPWKTPFATGGTLGGTLTVPASNGTATFNTLNIDKPAPGYTMSASATGLSSATSGPLTVNLTFTQITSGGNHTCGIATFAVYCWGANGSGQLAATTGSIARDSIAAIVRGGLTFTQVSAGGNHTCGITSANDAYCWGNNGSGQLGNGTFTSTGPTGLPVAVSGGLKFAIIDAGANHTCGITTSSATAAVDRQVYCWGAGFDGQLGNNTTGISSNVPVRAAEPLQTTTRAASISAGGSHTCVVALNSNAYCWGYDGLGQIGNDVTLASVAVPTLVAGGNTYLAITTGDYHTCGIVSIPSDTPARCWGYNYYGQLGDNTALTNGGQGINQPTPVALFGDLNFTAISAGSMHTCAVAVGGTAYCWGVLLGNQQRRPARR